ncbi:hypothetical protein IMZ11_41420 [Microtetraspora sp. AC03309]|uniref:hypothetical protein n=1 Tax=Microtetraspora sp. AC03309 TaxID=2779376 RepID=UPI001E29B05A|nr:hypothetical protein [Microtetraspora sp. AC03309]MCC5582077.1 hypothetical protein [Microtetraspora sp. AC03309]
MATTKTTARKSEARKADWSLASRGPIVATGQGALGLAAIAVAGDLAAIHPLWGGAATAVGAVATVVRSAHLAHPTPGLLYRLGCWLGAGSWLTYTLAAGLWSQAAWGVWGIGAVTAGLLAPLGRAAVSKAGTARRPSAPGTALVPRRHVALVEEWTRRIRRCCRLAVEIAEVREWPTGTGYSLLVMLPQGGATASQLANAAEGMANDARLPQGCGVEVLPPRPGQLRGTVWLEVATVNRLAADIDHPGDYSPRSVLDGITIGEYRNGEPMRLQVRQPRTIVVGTTGSAKTGTLHTITAELGRCVDGLVWHMDLNGGGVSQPWLRAWLDGEIERPAIDWAAPCAEEALLMAAAEVAIAKARKTAYSKRRMLADDDKLPVDHEVPQITTILDEGFEVLAPTVRDPLQKEIRSSIEEIARIGRAEACQVLVSALRSISTTLSTDLLSLLHNRIMMAGCAQKEITFLYEQAQGASVEDLAGPGSGFVRVFGNDEIRTWKAYRMKPARDIHPASASISRTRPNLDEPSVEAAGYAYATRYSRMRWLFSTPEQRVHLRRPRPIELPGVTDDRGNPVIWDPALTHPAEGDDLAPAPAPQHGPRTTPAAPAAPSRRLTAVACGTDASAWPDLREMTGKPAPRAMTSAAEWPDLPMPRRGELLRAEQIHAVTAAPAAPIRPIPELLRRALAAFGNDTRIHSEALAAALGIDVLALAALLRPLEVTTLPRAFLRGGAERRGYAREDLEAAAARIASGELEVPAEVATWPAA